jgi:ketosteroid isomerase-like protein
MWLLIGDAGRGSVAAPMSPAAVVAPATPAPTAESPSAEVAFAAPAAMPADGGESQARDLVERWRQAWASRDVEAYLRCYSADFLPADGQTRTAWAAARRKKLSRQSDISVQVHDIRLEHIDGDQLKAMFLQNYASGTYREDARSKTLRLVREDGDWRIAGEWQGTPPASTVGKS